MVASSDRMALVNLPVLVLRAVVRRWAARPWRTAFDVRKPVRIAEVVDATPRQDQCHDIRSVNAKAGDRFLGSADAPPTAAQSSAQQRSHASKAIFDELRDECVDVNAFAPSTFVAIVELERFAALRKSIGYRLANQLLEMLADRVEAAIVSAERGRIGRTTIEFAFNAASVEAATANLQGLVDTLEARLFVDAFSISPTVTIGFADAGQSSIRDELVDQAAAALSAAQAERRKIRFADPAVLSQNGLADLELMRALPRALASGEVSLYYQPKLHARTNTITSVEALIRWIRPGSGLVPTDRFIALAEETGAIRELSEWVITRAIDDQQRLIGRGHAVEVYVNISGQLLPDPGFAAAALALVRQAKGRIGFEITETAVISDPDAALANLRAFTEAGIRIAIDDYGSGLSSLAYLKQLPAQELKIDRMFVSGLTNSNRDPLLVRSSIDLAHALEMEVTAEGVDTAMSLSLLRIMGCDLLQGYFISPPLPLPQLIEFLRDEAHLERLVGPGTGQWQASLGA